MCQEELPISGQLFHQFLSKSTLKSFFWNRTRALAPFGPGLIFLSGQQTAESPAKQLRQGRFILFQTRLIPGIGESANPF
jgi:hypothetical protein